MDALAQNQGTGGRRGGRAVVVPDFCVVALVEPSRYYSLTPQPIPQPRPDLIRSPTASWRRALFCIRVLCARNALRLFNRALNLRLISLKLTTYKRQAYSTSHL